MAEQYPVISKLPTALSSSRLLFGLFQAGELLTTSPEERTWVDAGTSAGAALTDKLDGAWSRTFGSTEHGALIDQLADIAFSEGGRLALAVNNEISPIHPALGLGREAVVHALRWSAVANGHPRISVGNRGRQKITANMLLMVAARSPLSRRAGLLESMASFGTALSLMSGVGYAQEYLAGKKQTTASPGLVDSARNGSFRKASASPNDRIARLIDEKLPSITPDHLTLIGETLVETSIIAALLKPRWGTALGIGPYTLGGIIDGWDGNLARRKGTNSLKGMLKDVRADKRQEIITAAGNSLIASQHGNSVASSQYAVAAMTATLPAFFRAAAEAEGHIVSEDASGSRVVRGIEGGVGVGLNSQPGIANTVSALMVAGNIVTAAQRADVTLRGDVSPHYRGANHDPEFRAQAAARRDALLPVAVGGVAVGTGLLIKEHALSKQQTEETSPGLPDEFPHES